ncbi:MAG TPA: enoyl-CoA hydratase-related protein [Bacteroidota bacterium]|nr:enoyl-CoA hydratase-related protein [Bacteroidota bacterium]
MAYTTLLTEVADRIATVTVNRPEKLNALNAAAKEELRACFASLRTDSAVDVVVLTGAGDKAFVAGTDIGELAGLDEAGGKAFSEAGQSVFDAVANLGKPVIAAVNGYALGGGCELALACHIRIASDRAKFGQPEVNLGVIPGYGGTQRLARIVGRGRAMEMILTGVQLGAAEALACGLVSRVYPHDELMSRARSMASTIASMGQFAVRMALKAVNMTEEIPLSDGEKLEATLFGLCCGTGDFKEGTRAFLEKRKPHFTRQ